MALTIVRRSSLGWPSRPNVGTAPCKNGLVLHYDGSDQGLASKSHSACVAYWKNTRKFHMGPSRGWSDIGYSYGICPHGIVLEGRGFGYQQAAQPGGNSTYTSITFMSGEHEEPTAAQLKAWRDFRAYLRGKKGVGSAIKGHRNFISTSCPGGKLYKLVTNTKSPLYGSGSGTVAPPKLAAPSGSPLLREGSEGSRVGMLQRCLNKVLKSRLVVDGDFGPATKAKVIAFQKKVKITADGIYGPQTASKLAAELKKVTS